MTEQGAQAHPFQCQYCKRDFKRLEHVQRHERTHTKETPYQCPCGKAFPRGDLLRRHEKSAHGLETSKRKRSIVGQDGHSPGGRDDDANSNPWLRRQRTASISYTTHEGAGTPSVGVTVTSNGSHRATPGEQSVVGHVEQRLPPFATGGVTTVMDVNNAANTTQTGGLYMPEQPYMADPAIFGELRNDPFDLFGEGDAFLENVDFSSLFMPAGYGLSSDFQLDHTLPPMNQTHDSSGGGYPQSQKDTTAENGTEPNSISRFGSPLPSIRPGAKESMRQYDYRPPNSGRLVPRWKISVNDYSVIETTLAPLLPYLPEDFSLPSRHTISRYLEGCIRGPYEHTPYLHAPTWSVRSTAPDLLLSMLTLGAQYKYESSKAISLFYAAKAAVNYQLRLKDARMLGEFAQMSQRASRPEGMANGATPDFGRGESTAYPDINVEVDRLQTMQAVLTLMILASWGPRQLVGEAISFQGVLGELVREDGLSYEDSYHTDFAPDEDVHSAWLKWVRLESRRRTKLLAYTFVNVQSVAFNIAPSMLTSEILINTPSGQDVWNAKTAEAWLQASRTTKVISTGFLPAYRSLFQPPTPDTLIPNSALVNYALILAILQCIFLLRESSTTIPSADATENLRTEDIESLSAALQQWQERWESSPESTMEPVSAAGPVAFNSTALLRLAWIRLHANLGPCRNLASKDPNLIVDAFKSCPPLHRHAGLALPIVQAAHALCIPVRLGIAYVAKTQTITWSIQHSLSNLEAAIFLSKWFDTIASTIHSNPLTPQEQGLVLMIRRIVLETGFFKEDAFEPANTEEEWLRVIKHLGTAVAKLWAQVFSGGHIFDVVSTIGSSLAIWSRHLESAHTPIDADEH